ncbi:hypothetical protein ACFL5K_02290 [Gemmatimonadota bacterium]
MQTKTIIGLIFFIAIFNNILKAQECGPFCPVCSGTGSSTSALVAPGVFIPSILYIPKGEEEKGVVNFRGGITSWLDVGVGYTIEAEKLLWSCRLQALKENESTLRPTLILGIGSVQTGGSDQSLFLQLSKSWELNEIFSVRISSGIAGLIPELNEFYGLAGLTLTITETWSPFISYDGINFHPGLSWIPTDWLAIATILVESKEPAISVGFRFDSLQYK